MLVRGNLVIHRYTRYNCDGNLCARHKSNGHEKMSIQKYGGADSNYCLCLYQQHRHHKEVKRVFSSLTWLLSDVQCPGTP